MTSKNQTLGAMAHKYIPGGAHTYSRGDDQFPSNAPRALSRGQGAHVWDVDGNRFIDFGMALRSVTLGYNDHRVSAAAIAEILKGNNLPRVTETEILAAQEFCETIPGCDMVKFAKNGSTAVSAGVKLARAFTGRHMVARCAEHPFFSFDDWFIGDTDMNRGVPPGSANLVVRFNFNDAASLENLFRQYPGQIGCVVLEPASSTEPVPGFLKAVMELATKNGAVSILDEMITGFRWSLKGASDYYGVQPDLKTFGKGMANGFSVAALGGRREIMELGGINHSQERVFLISSTHGAEMCGLGAFRETLRIYKEEDVTAKLWSIGTRLVNEMRQIAQESGLEGHFVLQGALCSPVYFFKDQSGQVSQPLRTLFMQEMVKQGVLMPWMALSCSHTPDVVDLTLRAVREAFKTVREGLSKGVENFLVGPAAKPVFRKRN